MLALIHFEKEGSIQKLMKSGYNIKGLGVEGRILLGSLQFFQTISVMIGSIRGI